MLKVKIGDTVRLREGNLLRFGTVEEIHGEYAHIRLNGETLITSAMIGTLETVDTSKEANAAVSALRKLARSSLHEEDKRDGKDESKP
jgi:hypothetical protein